MLASWKCTWQQNAVSPSSSSKDGAFEAGKMKKEKGLAPLLIHFDVNKTVIQSDSIQMKSIEEGIREGIAELFWGQAQQDGDKLSWEWNRGGASCSPPACREEEVRRLVNYAQYCKLVCKDKDERKEAVKSFRLVADPEARAEMEKVLQLTVKKMQLPQEVRFKREAEEAGLKGSTLMMFQSVFHLVAALQRSKRTFGVLFRSFGADHETIKKEWNAFCEMRHPLFSKLIQGIGKMDGSVPGVPDRRIHSLHTLYRDAQGPVLILDTFTNGPPECSWDAWAKDKPVAKEDTRKGREFIHKVLKAETVEGIPKVADWMKKHLVQQKTAAIKDDWAWWQWNGESAQSGKLLTMIAGPDETKQLFFDDNIDYMDSRIVDCRDATGHPVPIAEAINKLCTKVNPVEALLDNEYFLRKLQVCHGEHLEMGASLVDFQQQLTEVEDQKAELQKKVTTLMHQLANLTEENRRMKLQHRVTVRDEAQLRDILAQEFDLDSFGRDGRKSVLDLSQELEQGLCWLENCENGGIVRVFEMVFMRVQYKDLILIESHEQDSAGRIQSRNYLPGVRKGVKETNFTEALDHWFEHGLPVNLKSLVSVESLPVSTPEAPSQQTQATQAYPIPCNVQMSRACYTISEKALETQKELLAKIGLPAGKHFTTTDRPRRLAAAGAPGGEASGAPGHEEEQGSSVTRFWRWDKVATWEATTAKAANTGSQVNIAEICEKLFRGHPRREVYENLLLQMFETFTAKKLCGGFSGSVVIRVQPFESDGRPGEPCIVKLDAGEAIREEYRNSENVFQALPDRAARILGDAVYARNKDSHEFGAMRLELAGACWNVPELAQGSANLLSTFKDLLLYESEQVLLGSEATAGDVRPFGNVHSVLAETFGPGGIVSSLRKGPTKGSGGGVRRAESQPLPWGWYSLKGKDSKFNPFTAKSEYSPEPFMRELYKKYFGTDMPDLRALVVGEIKPKLEKLANSGKKELCPLIALAHGDLNAANIMIDALDAVWLIDFATSVDLPLFTDMCKFEMACLFEYATIPITPKLFLDFATTREDNWVNLNVGDWVRVDHNVAEALLRNLGKMEPGRVQAMTQPELDRMIEEVARSRPPHKQREVVRALKARLTASQADMDGAFTYCAAVSKALLQGEYIFDTLSVKVPIPEGPGVAGALSLRFFMELSTSIRRFTKNEIQSCLREFSPTSHNCEPCDATSLQLWLPILRETYRILGYRDIAPQHKVWSIYHCHMVAQLVLKIIDGINKSINNLRGDLPIMKQLLADSNQRRATQKSIAPNAFFERDCFSEADSHWIYVHKDMFNSTPNSHHDRIVRTAHAECPIYNHRPGLFAPLYQVLPQQGDAPQPLRVRFSDRGAAGLPWSIHVLDAEDAVEGPRRSGEPVIDDEVIGYASGGAGGSDGPVVVFRSRLFVLTPFLLRRCTSKLAVGAADRHPRLHESFSFTGWSEGLFPASKEVQLLKSSNQKAAGKTPTGKEGANGAELPHGVSGITILVPESFHEFMRLDAVARDSSGSEVMRLVIVLGTTALCYPAGCKLCLDAPDREDSPEVVVTKLNESGFYQIRDVQDGTNATEREFDPSVGNHVFLKPCLYKPGQKIIMAEEHNLWVDAEVIDGAEEANGWRHRLMVTNIVAKHTSWMGDSTTCTTDEDGEPKEGSHKLLKHLSTMCSGSAWMSAVNYEEEVHKMKVFYRARHSFIIDALSGTRIDVKSCALPTLHMVSGPGVPEPLDGAEFAGRSESHRRALGTHFGDSPHGLRHNPSLNRLPSLLALGSKDIPRKGSLSVSSDLTGGQPPSAMLGRAPQDGRGGWGTILTTMERYEKARPSCEPNAFLVLGSPGSGKTCLICRLIMDCLDRQRDLVPVLLSVTDLVKRTDQEPGPEELDSAVHSWFDKYLRITFGEDSQRYKMQRQAICMHRAMFLIEGLEDAGNLAPVIDRLIRDIVLDRHLVVITSRPLLAGQSTLVEDMREHLITYNLMHLTAEQKRSIAHARLQGGIAPYDRFTKRLRQGQGLIGDKAGEEEDAAGEAAHEDVFGNPMMLSMLICYLQPSKDQQKAATDHAADQESDSVTLTAVYRVAIDVMLQRVQSKQQADRHNKEEKVGQCKRVLEKMAMAMQVQKRLDIEAGEFERLLSEKVLKEGWSSMMEAVEAGHAMFLRTSRDGGRLELRFLVRGFQSFFAASEVSSSGGRDLPDILKLLKEPWWAEMLDMLAEAWPHKYVKLVENRLERSESFWQEGNSFLHLAAEVGHRPVFQLLKLFSEANQAVLHKRNAEKRTPLHTAARKGFTHLCKLMLEHKAEADAEDVSERLPMHVAMQHGHFQTAKYLLESWTEAHKGPGAGKNRRGVKDNPAEKLAARVLGHAPGPPLEEGAFKVALEETFAELRFFSKNDQTDMKRSMGALMAVFWIVGNHYDLFVREQRKKGNDPLTKQSWENLQEWTQKTVGLTSNPAKVGAMLVIVAVQSVGKIKPFKKTFAPDYEEASEALASVLQKDPVLIPSFSKLEEHMQHMILAALKADFNFGQFLQAENLPASLEVVKKILNETESSDNLLGFFLFRIFAQMCGILGAASLEGSLFMNEKQYTNFKVGLDVFQYLKDGTAQEVYDRFLEKRAQKFNFTFNPGNKESRAQVRLACLSRFQDEKQGREVSAAFTAMDPKDRKALSDYLTADGINQKGFLLYNSPLFMANAAANENIGLMPAMNMLLKVYQLADKEYRNSDQQVVTIYVEDLAKYAKECRDREVFNFTQFDIKRASGHKSDSQGSVHLSPWQLENSPQKWGHLAQEGDSLAMDVMSKAMREPMFHRKLPEVFPEMSYMNGEEDPVVRKVCRQTVCSLLVLYWLASDQLEAFTRGQAADEKLTEKSWNAILNWTKFIGDTELNVLLVAVMLHGLGKIPKFRAQLAPHAMDHRQVLAHVIKTCPKVLPSYMRLEAQFRKSVQECLIREFDFQQFLHAENLPANLITIKEMLQGPESSQPYIDTFLVCIFAEISGSLGAESLEGSLYMTEERFEKFSVGMEAMKLLTEGKNVQDVYDRLLQKRADACGLHFSHRDPHSRAVVRLACLAQVRKGSEAEELKETFKGLDNKERAALIKFLNADGIREKPGFILSGSPDFLASARANTEVGLLPATRILLRVYESAAKEFHGSSAAVITIQLGKLTTFAKEFFGAVAFQDMPFNLERRSETEALVMPKAWIPVTNPMVLHKLGHDSLELAEDVLKRQVTEDMFKARIGRIFPELNYFHAAVAVQRDQTLAAMLSVYWLLSGHYEAFTRNQQHDEQLSKQSWEWIQEWMKQTVKLSTPEAVDAALVFMAIHALGKIKEFREELSRGFSAGMHDIALSSILNSSAQVVPSFSRLSDKYQGLIVDSLSVDFQFSQFLQAENTPANLVVIKQKMIKHGDEGFAFFCFRIFAQMCGKLGYKSLRGSEFMNEAQFERFKPGLEALMELKTRDPLETYNNFLLLRGSKAMSRFASPEHQALSRLLTLSAAYNHKAGHDVCDAFDQLTSDERVKLTRWLNSDGITPGQISYVLCDAPRFLQNAKVNRAVGLCSALRMLLRVQERCTAEYLPSSNRRVVVRLAALAEWAREAGPDHEDFLQATLRLECEAQAEAKIMSIGVVRPEGHAGLPDGSPAAGASRRCPRSGRLALLLLAGLGLLGLAICLGFSEGAAALLPGNGRALRGPAAAALAGAAFLLGLLLAWQCLAGRPQHGEAPTAAQEAAMQEPFLRLDAWSPRLGGGGRHEYSRLQQTDDEDTV